MKKKLRLRHAIFAATAVIVPACIQTCESASSDTVLTSGIRANFRVTSIGEGQTAIAGDLRVGGGLSNVYLELVGDDILKAKRGRISGKFYRRSEPFGMIRYHSILNGDSSGKDIAISLNRSVDKGAPKSEVRMPPAFTLTSPTPHSTLSRSVDTLSIKWDNPSNEIPIAIAVEGSCIRPVVRQIEVDQGLLHLPPGSLRAPNRQMKEMQPTKPSRTGTGGAPVPVKALEKCRVTVRAVRTRSGKIDPAYGQGGSIIAEQIRKISFNSVP